MSHCHRSEVERNRGDQMRLRKIGIVVALVALAGLALYINQNRHSQPSDHTIHRTFTVQHTTTITEQAGSLTLRFSPQLKVVLAAKASTDKGYFSLKCMGRSELTSVPGNGQWVATTCRLAEVHYTDNSAATGLVILKPRR